MAADPRSSQPPGFAALAKRISLWTTNVLLTLLVLVAGLGFGRQVLKWWAADAQPAGPVVATDAGGLGDPSLLHTIQFGDSSWSLRRQSITGDKNSAVERLRAACRDLLTKPRPVVAPTKPRPVVAPTKPRPVVAPTKPRPVVAPTKPRPVVAPTKPRPVVAPEDTAHATTADSQNPDGATNGRVDNPGATNGRGNTTGATNGRGFMAEEFLTFLSEHSTPVDRQPGRWRLYEFHEAIPMAAGLARPAGDNATQNDEPAGANLAQLGYRVIVWGIAMPAGPDSWTVCTFQPESPPTVDAGKLSDIPLPPDARKGLSLRSAGGGGLTAFRGPDRPQEWKRFYDDWFGRNGGQTVVGWQSAGDGWCARFAAPDKTVAADIRFGPDGRGDLSGLMMIAAPETK